MTRTLTISGEYLGGHEGREKVAKPAFLNIDDEGVSIRASFRTAVREPWSRIASINVDGDESLQTRFTATRLALIGPFALAFKKKKSRKNGYLTIETDGGVIVFHTEKMEPHEITAKLSPWRSRPAGMSAQGGGGE
jgi:hypothetical protein